MFSAISDRLHPAAFGSRPPSPIEIVIVSKKGRKNRAACSEAVSLFIEVMHADVESSTIYIIRLFARADQT
jgi:hypothetical protein